MLRIKYLRVLALFSKQERYYTKNVYLPFIIHLFIPIDVLYCNWGIASQIHLQPLFLTQKKVVRIITLSHYLAHTQPLFQSLSILPVNKLFLNQIGIGMYKYCNAYTYQ